MFGRLRYALDDSHADKSCFEAWAWLPYWCQRLVGRLQRARCRWTGHPCGVWFYNVGGTEPNMHCIGCGEDLG